MGEINRRNFLTAAGAALSVSPGAGQPAAAPWHARIRRVGQVNMTERDPVELDVTAWADYWASLKADAVLVSVTGILAFYPSAVPFHRHGAFLNGRDFFGECCAAAKKRGIRVIARMSPDLQWEEALGPHPEWFQRDARGAFVPHGEDRRLYRTCMFSTYYTGHIAAIMREVNARYDIDGIFTNAWPPLGRFPECYCDVCRAQPPAGSPAYWDGFNERVLFLWRFFDGIAKEKRPDNLYFANLGGGIRATPNLKLLGEICEWFNCDNQGRGGEDAPIWGCAKQGRVCYAAMKGRTSTNVTAAWSTGQVRWRNVAKSPAEAEVWMDQTLASGMVPWYHFIGAQGGLGEDRRWHEPGRRYFNWIARNDRHLFNRRSIANLGIVMGQRTNLFYDPPGGGSVAQFMDGLYYALLEGRFLFDFVHEDDLGAENLKKYDALALPNIALLSDEQCRQLRAYAESGGSLLSTFETGLYTERNEPRPDFGLADVFGVHRASAVQGPNGNSFYAWIERQHEILAGFSDTCWLPGAEYRAPLKPVSSPVLTVVPPYPSYPPELSYLRRRTDEPAVVVLEQGRSRRIHFAGDVERSMWRSGHTDLSRLLQNAVRWILRDSSPVSIEGEGLIETFAWETEAGFALHALNYTNPNLHRGWLRRHYPIGPQKVRMTLPGGGKPARVELLKAGREVKFSIKGRIIEFTIPRIEDYEIAAISI
ncbi:MAG: beta-galactosidase trimerization domain-containing protein [Bryobacteraceae bacterium]|nr:beta-galactosidase trimerization domain-containing protein [Bryobacteraceae bacterium]